MSDEMLTAVAAFVTALGVGPILLKLLEHVIKKRKDKNLEKKSFSSVLKATHEIYFILMLILRKCAAHRVLLLVSTNGGGRPKIGGELYSSVVFEAFENPMRSIREDWQKQKLDPAYVDMLYEMNKEGALLVVADKLPENSILRNLFKEQGIVQSYVVKVSEKETKYFYASVNFTRRVDIDEATKELFRSQFTKLSRIFNENENF